MRYQWAFYFLYNAPSACMKGINSENGNLSFFTQYSQQQTNKNVSYFHSFILQSSLNLKSLECNVGGEDLLTLQKWNFWKTFQGVFWMKLLLKDLKDSLFQVCFIFKQMYYKKVAILFFPLL